ncbi:precorrin-6A/cobalt-precorrin-6A reductase [Pseudomonas citronellolis]|uniref:Precorrin-6A/cobalt-precorrin-6A reductase n=1 Tax=Pseudomonas citronellolis TaxID=53408 RepID=A0AAQ1HQ99_9PSED|nr:cobalt-precorrin-6A reductase [Pseudomonas citronellolis]MCP1642861.1 precorrin-6A/cobalt-precorrin-6A reductase [Pseudomonas citronellolis]MCP1666007.1 precorrin-6A/cobalt-precorrin-6A reductase [Pseudomonas citronellolis]MCP1696916.1 precorrin-6A/cobalt-precorrin-6A reductase [Pseudomonas citronellolis]MCP1703342.1 precorrin-6A/cobalt-precorrin-6A reductase [Pseudomonas citronellolis]MCP1797476.1 precorrin-6A/cobalt-precorrin-6A reductase [Pseudomonas citronellolis]
MSGKRILLLGGIGEALAIARRLGPGHLYSLAGLGKVPDDLACQVRVGGYGGAEGLADFIAGQGYDLLLDATHPYAAQISRNAARAAQLAGVPCWALRRPGWHPRAGDDWREVEGWAQLIAALAPFERPLFTLGREPLEHLGEIPEHQFWTVRCLQSLPGTERAEVLGARGPFSLEGERELFVRLGTDVLVSKNSGSQATEPKLQVARERGVPVLILARPELPEVDRRFDSVEALWTALEPLL